MVAIGRDPLVVRNVSIIVFSVKAHVYVSALDVITMELVLLVTVSVLVCLCLDNIRIVGFQHATCPVSLSTVHHIRIGGVHKVVARTYHTPRQHSDETNNSSAC